MKKEDENHYKLVGTNRKAFFNYEVLSELECGIVLSGTEVKSIREGRINFVDSFCEIIKDELFLQKLHISPYDFGNIFNHSVDRPRKLLAHKKEIAKLQRATIEKGMTLIPVKFYFKQRRVKVLVAVCRGKKLYDKRESIKQRDIDRQTARELK